MIDKYLFHKQLRDFISRNDIGIASEMTEDSIIVCTAVEDFDSTTNDVWNIEANRSYPRDVVCRECKRPVVMSGGMFSMYEKAERKTPVACGRCVFKIK